MSNNKSFAATGALNTPNTNVMPVGQIMSEVARTLVIERGYTMTGGRGAGADAYFERGLANAGRDLVAEGLFKGFMPDKAFNGHQDGIVITDEGINSRARKLLVDSGVYAQSPGGKIPRFMTLEGADVALLTARELSVRDLHTRMAFVIMRENLDDPVKMLICWTPDGATMLSECRTGVTGATGIAIALARALGIPVFNLNRQDHLDRICGFIGLDAPQILYPWSSELSPLC